MGDHDCEYYINSINELIYFATKIKDKLIFDKKINENVKILDKFTEKIKTENSKRNCRREFKKKRTDISTSEDEDEDDNIIMKLEDNNKDILCFMNEVLNKHKKINDL